MKVKSAPDEIFTRTVVSLIHTGSTPEVCCRAMGVQAVSFRSWVKQGFDDITLGLKSPFSAFTQAVDAAMAQEEVKAVAKINRRVNNWQAISWVQERKNFQRWGTKNTQITGSFDDMRASLTEEQKVLEPDVAADVLRILEESGYTRIAGPQSEENVIDITGKPVADEVPAEQSSDQTEPEVPPTYASESTEDSQD
jgi:hypothetical protein